jgi:ABC-type multidrug transport system fused ATPase/permease subunit
VAPFVAVLGNSQAVDSNAQLAWFNQTLGLTSPRDLLVVLGILMITLVIVRNTVFALCIWYMTSTMSMFTHHLATRLFTSYLHRPFPFFLRHNTLDLRRICTEETKMAVDGVLRPLLNSVAQIVTCAFIVTYLFIIDPVVAAVSMATLGGAYALVYGTLRYRLRTISRTRLVLRAQRLKTATAAFDGIRDLLLAHNQRGFLQEFGSVSHANARAEAIGRTMSALPRYLIESAAVAGLVVFMLVLTDAPAASMDPLPLVALYMAAGYRLLPALQQTYANITRIRFDEASFAALERHLPEGSVGIEPTEADEVAKSFSHRLEFANVSFRYPSTARDAIRGLNLSIDRHSAVALVGPTGGGKSTVLDLLSGLLAPSQGEIRIDGSPATLASASWQKRIGYVPQHIHLKQFIKISHVDSRNIKKNPWARSNCI